MFGRFSVIRLATSLKSKRRESSPLPAFQLGLIGSHQHLMRTLSHRDPSASMALLRGILLSLFLRPRLLRSLLRRRRTRSLLVPLVELLLLLPFLLRRPLLYRRRRPHQRMRFPRSGPHLRLRLRILPLVCLSAILLRVHIPVFRLRIAVCLLRVSLLLVRAGRGRLPHLITAVVAVWHGEWTEAFLRSPALARRRRRGSRRASRTNQ